MSSENEWNCTICNSNESYPMMIIKCGHTFCEECLEHLKTCSICRTPFTILDCQPNFALVSGNKQPVKRNCNLDTKLKDLVRKIQVNLDVLVNQTVESIINQIDNQLIEYPKQTLYKCEIDNPSVELVSEVITLLSKYGLLVDFTDDLKNGLKENREKIILQIYLKNGKKYTTSSGTSNYLTNYLTNLGNVTSTNY